jgi:hypothetical protein
MPQEVPVKDASSPPREGFSKRVVGSSYDVVKKKIDAQHIKIDALSQVVREDLHDEGLEDEELRQAQAALKESLNAVTASERRVAELRSAWEESFALDAAGISLEVHSAASRAGISLG